MGPRDNGNGYDADWFRVALKDKGIRACIPGRKQRKIAVKHDKHRYNRRNRIEIMFGRQKDWRTVATRYDRCPEVFPSAIALAARVIYWVRSPTIGDPADIEALATILPDPANVPCFVRISEGISFRNVICRTKTDCPLFLPT